MRSKVGLACMLGVVAAFTVPAPAALAYTAFVTNEKDNTVSVIDTDKLEVIKTFKVGQRPRGVILSNDAKWLIICTSDENLIQVYDTKTYQLVKTLPSGPDPELLVLHPSGNPLYVANEDDNLVTVVDINSGKVITDIPVGVEPEGHGHEPRRQGAGQHLRNDQHGPLHRHRDAQDVRQRAGRQPPAHGDVQHARERSSG